ncbi:acyltransferase family protein [Mucilaginibacter phyllosphaerae]|uniref:Acyltransferase n=1 Tax=Mucilaginibacter phyllosphaerae TaxID=1812349 RepID=A0A4Y8AI35_9SPHI|nr:acyltransferase [Mucilaginibacter phyllosphaerae]MBB3968247.1 peptidoglycan/LPS O-acetylase OafA/YrhL [Mucilaginibacter phyllosphaerae]TEW68746.1 acyltransferase [Mucilaginibacter phyllosphaerae]GGH00236.1 acyltransferase [Mucilaginibacter phyllosphaerae]
MNNNELATKPHYPILDGLRGVAAIIVVTFHLCEPLSTGNLDKLVNHGYLAVDFFFLLSGFVIGYAYDDRWHKITAGSFFKRRIERLQPMVVLGMTLGAIGFYFTDSALWPLIHTIPVWKMLLVMLIGYTILPVPLSLDIRGWEEMHPLNSVGWSLFFEYFANILYALWIRKFSKTALTILVGIAAVALAHLAIINGDVSGGWTLNVQQVRIGLTRTMYPFFAGLLLSRVAKPTPIKNAFLWCSLLVIVVLFIPRIGGAEHLWMNGIYESVCIIVVFPFIVYIGASGVIQNLTEHKICKFLGDISYPLYLVHYPLVYFYVAWISNHKGITIAQTWPYALLILAGSIILAYATLKWYDEPLRKWLRKKLA